MGIFRKNKRQFSIRSHRKLFVAIFLVTLFGISGIISLIMNAMAADVPVPSVEILSQKSSYPDGHPGAWKITKSAEWAELNKARIEFKVESVPKLDNSKKLDVVMVIDNSGSMSGNKIEQVKSDASDLINVLLSDSENKAALVTFESNASILSEFSNNKELMLDLINNIQVAGCTNYYDGLLKAESVLANYEQNTDRELVLLFLTDGYPNEQTPNEKAQYRTLKEKFPFMVINGVQYEMGNEVLQPIIDVSDNQFIASMSTLNNVLFEAAAATYYYDNFTITDYIDDDYWTVASIDSIQTKLGNVELNYDGATPIVNWNLNGLYRSGQTISLTIDINLKSDFVDINTLLPTNKHEIITSSLIGVPDENVDTDDTPKLKNVYDVIYDANVPDGCEISGTVPATSSHTIFSTVEISDNRLSCSNHKFVGWQIATEDVTRINGDYFRMPSQDVHIKATWAKLQISKSMNGKTHIRGKATLAKGTSVNGTMKRLASASSNSSYASTDNNIIGIERSDTPPDTINSSYTVNLISDSSSQLPVYAWYDGGIIYYYSDAEEIYMNANSADMFSRFNALESINGAAGWIASNVTNMSSMFANNTNLSDINGLANWDTSSVTTMKGMFESMSSLTNIDALEHWDTSNVADMSNMFSSNKSISNMNGALNWNVSSVTNMSGMFSYASALVNIDGLANWDTSSVTTMGSMFQYTGIIDIDALATKNVDGKVRWDTSNVTNMSGMFAYTNAMTNANGAVNWDTSKVTNMSSMFASSNISDLSGLANWDTSNVANMSRMFSEDIKVTDLSALTNWDTSNVTNMSSMFSSVKTTNIDALATKTVGGKVRWNTSNVTNMSNMFACSYGSTLTNIDGAVNWNTSNVTTMEDMFYGATTLASIDGAVNWNTSNVTTMMGMFSYTNLPNINGAANWDTSKVTTMRFMFYAVSALTNLSGAANWDVSNVKDMSSMFENASGLTNIDGTINWRLTSLENASSMFERATNLKNIDGAINWGLSSLKNASSMFEHNINLVNIDGAINWDVSNVTSMYSMFGATYELTNINGAKNWDTSSVTSMSGMFWASHVSDISGATNWNTSSLTDMDFLFDGIYASNIDLRTKVVNGTVRWDTSKVKNMTSAFDGIGGNSASISINLSNWDTSSVTRMSGMFNGAGRNSNSITINLSGWNTSNVTNMSNMFSNTGANATTWIVTIPANNGSGINNTTSSFFGSTTSVYASPISGKSFTLATP